MKKKYSNGIFLLLFIMGICIACYPFISDFINSYKQDQVITSYMENVSQIDEEEYELEMNEARKYNEFISQYFHIKDVLIAEKNYDGKKYEELLCFDAMGVLEIPSLQIHLPIYHGTNEDVLQTGVGHYRGSSLPIGGESTHSVLTGHTGLPSSRLLTDIDQLVEGDIFYIQVLNEKLAYEVDQVKVVLPEELDDINIVEGEDYCTLVTCTPYGINSHRLLVRGKRIPYVNTTQILIDELQQLSLFICIVILIIIYFIGRWFIKKIKRKKEIDDVKKNSKN